MPDVSKTPSQWDQLAKELGSTKGLDPIPPDQYLTFQDKRYENPERVWAWMLANTMRKGRRSAFAVDAKGNPLYFKDIAVDLFPNSKPEVGLSLVSKAWAILEYEGRVRKVGRKLFLCGDVCLPEEKGEHRAKELTVYRIFPDYILLQINKLEQKAKETFFEREKLLTERTKRLEAELIAAARTISERQYDALFADFQIKKRRDDKPRRKKGEDKPTVNPLREAIIPTLEKFVQSNSEFCTEPSFASSSPSVQNILPAASLVSLEGIVGTSIAAAFPTLPERKDAAAADALGLLRSELGRRGLIVQDALMLDKINTAKGACPLHHFLDLLDTRMSTGKKIGTGVLTRIAEDARKDFYEKYGEEEQIA